jgi:hypothetical protein
VIRVDWFGLKGKIRDRSTSRELQAGLRKAASAADFDVVSITADGNRGTTGSRPTGVF